MSDPSNVAKSLRERLGANTEDRLGKALSDLLENPMLTTALGHAFDAREKASQAQEVALGALNIPSAADIERLTRRLRSVSHRLEGIEDGVDRLDRALAPSGVEARLSAIEAQLHTLTAKIEQALLGVTAGAARVPGASGPRTPAAASSPAKAPGKAPAARARAKQPSAKAAGTGAKPRPAAAGAKRAKPGPAAG
jgi:hypothetical protein